MWVAIGGADLLFWAVAKLTKLGVGPYSNCDGWRGHAKDCRRAKPSYACVTPNRPPNQQKTKPQHVRQGCRKLIDRLVSRFNGFHCLWLGAFQSTVQQRCRRIPQTLRHYCAFTSATRSDVSLIVVFELCSNFTFDWLYSQCLEAEVLPKVGAARAADM